MPLINNINPYTISTINYLPGRRIGKHPLYYLLKRKKYPLLSKLFPKAFYPALGDKYIKATVYIYGSDGSTLAGISCRSTEHATRLAYKMLEELNKTLKHYTY